MKEYFDKIYADFILSFCLSHYKNKRLLIEYNDSEITNFAKVLREKALSMGFLEVEFSYADTKEKSEYLNRTPLEDITLNPLIDKTKWSEYALAGDAILHINTFDPTDYHVESSKRKKALALSLETSKGYHENNQRYNFPWLIVGYPNTKWAQFLYPGDPNAFLRLYENIIKGVMLDLDNPEGRWEEFIKKSNDIKERLNSEAYSKFIIQNGLGTNLEVGMLSSYKFLNIDKTGDKGEKMIVNMPSYEIFTSPDYRMTNGVVYNSKPLIYQNKIIDGFCLYFKDGKVVDYSCKEGSKLLEEILSIPNANQLGEFSFVEYDSPIQRTGEVFYNTLYDENASCHLALGKANPTCLLGVSDKSNESLLNHGVNVSSTHIDFMFETSDTNIYGEKGMTRKLVYKNGKFNL